VTPRVAAVPCVGSSDAAGARGGGARRAHVTSNLCNEDNHKKHKKHKKQKIHKNEAPEPEGDEHPPGLFKHDPLSDSDSDDEAWPAAVEQAWQDDSSKIVWGTTDGKCEYDLYLEEPYGEDGAPGDDPLAAPLPWDEGFRSSLRSIPSETDWEVALQGVPEPEVWNNPPPWRVCVKFCAGMATTRDAGGRPTTIETFDRILPRAAQFARKIVIDSGYTLRPSRPPTSIDRPNYEVRGVKRSVVIAKAVKCLKYGVIRTVSVVYLV
jgi:hypothetical protein